MLGPLSQCVCTQCGTAHGSFTSQPVLKFRFKAAGVDQEVREWDKSSDHAPTWVELRIESVKRVPTRVAKKRGK